jgi:lytic murein transglycosylase
MVAQPNETRMISIMRLALTLAAGLFLPAHGYAACGGSFSGFVKGLATEARSMGYDDATVAEFLSSVRQDPAVLRADRRQGVFQMPFLDFSRRLISSQRLEKGRSLSRQYDAIFDRIESEYGVSRGVLLAFWAFETDYGGFQGDFNTLNSLVTLAHDCRRPELFRPQIFAALELYTRGAFDPERTTGAWAGEIGMVQMLPEDILENGVDADADGRVDLKGSVPDALVSGAKMLVDLGWRRNEPWLQEVTVPDDFDWTLSGLGTEHPASEWHAMGVEGRTGALADLPASLILPQGPKGPAFLGYPNLDVYFEWNQSFTYVITAAYFATRLEGAPVYDAGNPEPGLGGEEMKALQRKLVARGHDVGDVDGILGAKTRVAVRAEQERLGLPVDAWPTPELLNRL